MPGKECGLHRYYICASQKPSWASLLLLCSCALKNSYLEASVRCMTSLWVVWLFEINSIKLITFSCEQIRQQTFLSLLHKCFWLQWLIITQCIWDRTWILWWGECYHTSRTSQDRYWLGSYSETMWAFLCKVSASKFVMVCCSSDQIQFSLLPRVNSQLPLSSLSTSCVFFNVSRKNKRFLVLKHSQCN